ncbi:MAG: hypothetical protein ABEI99_12615 [Halobaculum sp.]
MVVHYHLPENDALSISFVNPDLDVVEDEESTYREQTTAIRRYYLEQPVHVLYTGTEPPETSRIVETSHESVLRQMEESNRIITIRVLGALSSLVSESRSSASEELRSYKSLEPGGVATALDRTAWDGTVPEVGGRLLSNLLFRHPLPNANHRVSLALVERYVAAHECGSDAADETEFDWTDWVDEYVRESKRLLTVGRNAPRFFYLESFGCDRVAGKGGIEILLDEHELFTDIERSLDHHARRHRRLCVDLVETLLDEQNRGGLSERPGLSKTAFARRLREMD